MKYRVMITSLYRGDSNEGVKYYYTRQDERKKYCDAMLSAEASCKYVLSNYKIDEILTFGTKSTHDEGDELIPILLREGSEIGERMNKIKHAIEFFIKSYDDVRSLIENSGREKNVIEIESADIVGYSNLLRAELRKSKYGKGKDKDKNKDQDQTDNQNSDNQNNDNQNNNLKTNTDTDKDNK